MGHCRSSLPLRTTPGGRQGFVETEVERRLRKPWARWNRAASGSRIAPGSRVSGMTPSIFLPLLNLPSDFLTILRRRFACRQAFCGRGRQRITFESIFAAFERAPSAYQNRGVVGWISGGGRSQGRSVRFVDFEFCVRGYAAMRMPAHVGIMGVNPA